MLSSSPFVATHKRAQILAKCNIAALEAISIAELKDGDPQWQRDGGIGNAERRAGLSRREKNKSCTNSDPLDLQLFNFVGSHSQTRSRSIIRVHFGNSATCVLLQIGFCPAFCPSVVCCKLRNTSGPSIGSRYGLRVRFTVLRLAIFLSGGVMYSRGKNRRVQRAGGPTRDVPLA